MAWRHRLLENWQLKALSVVFAIALWLFVVSEDRAETVFTVPIEFQNIPQGLEITAMEPESVEIRVRGLRGILFQVREGDLRVPVSLKGTQPGETIVRLGLDQIQLPRGIEALRITPSRLRVRLKRVG